MLVAEGLTTVSYALDEALVAFDTALKERVRHRCLFSKLLAITLWPATQTEFNVCITQTAHCRVCRVYTFCASVERPVASNEAGQDCAMCLISALALLLTDSSPCMLVHCQRAGSSMLLHNKSYVSCPWPRVHGQCMHWVLTKLWICAGPARRTGHPGAFGADPRNKCTLGTTGRSCT